MHPEILLQDSHHEEHAKIRLGALIFFWMFFEAMEIPLGFRANVIRPSIDLAKCAFEVDALSARQARSALEICAGDVFLVNVGYFRHGRLRQIGLDWSIRCKLGRMLLGVGKGSCKQRQG